MYVPPLGQYITDGRGRTSGAGVTRRVRKPSPVRGGGRKGGEFHGMGLVIIFWNRAWMRLGMVYFPPDRRVGQIQAWPQKKSSRKTGKLPPEAAGTGRSLAIST